MPNPVLDLLTQAYLAQSQPDLFAASGQTAASPSAAAVAPGASGTAPAVSGGETSPTAPAISAGQAASASQLLALLLGQPQGPNTQARAMAPFAGAAAFNDPALQALTDPASYVGSGRPVRGGFDSTYTLSSGARDSAAAALFRYLNGG